MIERIRTKPPKPTPGAEKETKLLPEPDRLAGFFLRLWAAIWAVLGLMTMLK